MERIEGYVDHIIYRNQDNGYTVMNVVADGEEITCVGMLHYIGDGELVEISGHYKEHATMDTSFISRLWKSRPRKTNSY